MTVPGPVAEVTVAALGRTTITATATDRLGRQAAIQVVVDVAGTFDVDPPVVQCGPLPTQWHAANVTINCTASDAGSGLADPGQASFSLSTSVIDGVETAVAATGSASVCDGAGNCIRVGPFGPLKVDRAAPTVRVALPRPGEQLLLRDLVEGDVTCDDGGSGVASCQIGAIDTATPGEHSVNATASDAVGNTVTVPVNYFVRYAWRASHCPSSIRPSATRASPGGRIR